MWKEIKTDLWRFSCSSVMVCVWSDHHVQVSSHLPRVCQHVLPGGTSTVQHSSIVLNGKNWFGSSIVLIPLVKRGCWQVFRLKHQTGMSAVYTDDSTVQEKLRLKAFCCYIQISSQDYVIITQESWQNSSSNSGIGQFSTVNLLLISLGHQRSKFARADCFLWWENTDIEFNKVKKSVATLFDPFTGFILIEQWKSQAWSQIQKNKPSPPLWAVWINNSFGKLLWHLMTIVILFM